MCRVLPQWANPGSVAAGALDFGTAGLLQTERGASSASQVSVLEPGRWFHSACPPDWPLFQECHAEELLLAFYQPPEVRDHVSEAPEAASPGE